MSKQVTFAVRSPNSEDSPDSWRFESDSESWLAAISHGSYTNGKQRNAVSALPHLIFTHQEMLRALQAANRPIRDANLAATRFDPDDVRVVAPMFASLIVASCVDNYSLNVGWVGDCAGFWVSPDDVTVMTPQKLSAHDRLLGEFGLGDLDLLRSVSNIFRFEISEGTRDRILVLATRAAWRGWQKTALRRFEASMVSADETAVPLDGDWFEPLAKRFDDTDRLTDTRLAAAVVREAVQLELRNPGGLLSARIADRLKAATSDEATFLVIADRFGEPVLVAS